MNIFLRELRANLKALLIWGGIMIALIAMMMSEFKAYYNNPEMMGILEAMPESMMKALSFSGVNITTLSGFMTMASLYFYLMLTVYSAISGSSIIAKEERDRTAEFLMVMPVSRRRMLSAKVAAAVAYSLALNIITFGAVLIASTRYNPDAEFLRFSALMMAAVFLLQLLFASIGMLFASILKHPKKSGTAVIIILMITYVLSIAISLTDSLEFLEVLSPFTYFKPDYLNIHKSLELRNIILSAGVIAAGLIVTFTVYPRRDIKM